MSSNIIFYMISNMADENIYCNNRDCSCSVTGDSACKTQADGGGEYCRDRIIIADNVILV